MSEATRQQEVSIGGRLGEKVFLEKEEQERVPKEVLRHAVVDLGVLTPESYLRRLLKTIDDQRCRGREFVYASVDSSLGFSSTQLSELLRANGGCSFVFELGSRKNAFLDDKFSEVEPLLATFKQYGVYAIEWRPSGVSTNVAARYIDAKMQLLAEGELAIGANIGCSYGFWLPGIK